MPHGRRLTHDHGDGMNADGTYETVNTDGAPSPEDFDEPETSTGFKCSMSGFTDLTVEFVELLLVVISMFKELIATILDGNLAKAVKYFYQGLTGASGWIGYIVASAYYVLLDMGYGQDFCEMYGYLYVVVDALYVIIDFGEKIDQDAGY